MTPRPVDFRGLTSGDAAAALALLAGARPAPMVTASAEATAAAWSAPGAGFAAIDQDRGLTALATLHLAPSIYTGADWAHIEDVVVRSTVGAQLTEPLLRHARTELAARGFPQTSVGIPPGQEWLAVAARAAGFVDELLYMSRGALGDLRDRVPTGWRSAVPAGLSVRAAHDGDAAALDELVAVFARDFGYPSGADTATVRDFLGRPNTGAMIAELEGEPAGFIATSSAFSLHHGGPTLMLDDLFVRPEARRRGIARALVEGSLESAAARGATTARLWMQGDDEVARRFYASLGFSADGHVLMLPEDAR